MTETEARCRAALAYLAESGGTASAVDVLPDLTPDQRAPVVRLLGRAGLARYEGGEARRWTLTGPGWRAAHGRS